MEGGPEYFDRGKLPWVNLVQNGRVINYYGITGKSCYQPFIGQTTDFYILVNEIDEFMATNEANKELVLASLPSTDDFGKKIKPLKKRCLEEIKDVLEKSGLKINLIFN